MSCSSDEDVAWSNSQAVAFGTEPAIKGGIAGGSSGGGGGSGQGKSKGKWFNDPLHGFIRAAPFAVDIIDTPSFQRLRDLYQLGAAYWVWPCAAHKRFEHSIGTYHLAEKMMQNFHVQATSARSRGLRAADAPGAGLEIGARDIQLVSVAGLVHDLGHGPFSHVFDSEVVQRLFPGTPAEAQWTHEGMTCKMFDWLVDAHHLDYDETARRTVHALVTASEDKDLARHCRRERPWLYEVVSNPRNSVDVDKFDYMPRDARATGVNGSCNFERLVKFARVIDGEICWWTKDSFNLYQMFAQRAHMHKTVYTHPKVKAVEYMVCDALVEASDFLGLKECCHDPERFASLSDYILKMVEHARPAGGWESWQGQKGRSAVVRAAGGEADGGAGASSSSSSSSSSGGGGCAVRQAAHALAAVESDQWEGVRRAQSVIKRINNRQLYKFCGAAMVPKERVSAFSKVTVEQILACQPAANLTAADVLVHNQTINFAMGAMDPLKRLHFFRDFDADEKEGVDRSQISSLISDFFQERSVRVFCRSSDPAKQEAATQALEQFTRRQALCVGTATPGTPGSAAREAAHTELSQQKKRKLSSHPDMGSWAGPASSS
jgi:deoxynucleoside triphosphate triphosphohydrolase SAMHD1